MKVDGKPYRTIWLGSDGITVQAIDQTLLPHAFVVRDLRNVADATNAIRNMVVRGAPLIGAAAAYGMALANVYASLEMGIATYHASVAGLGGCPYAKGATGNVATEDVLYLLDGLGIETGIDMNKLIAAGDYICDFLGRPTLSRVARAIRAKAA